MSLPWPHQDGCGVHFCYRGELTFLLFANAAHATLEIGKNDATSRWKHVSICTTFLTLNPDRSFMFIHLFPSNNSNGTTRHVCGSQSSSWHNRNPAIFTRCCEGDDGRSMMRCAMYKNYVISLYIFVAQKEMRDAGGIYERPISLPADI